MLGKQVTINYCLDSIKDATILWAVKAMYVRDELVRAFIVQTK